MSKLRLGTALIGFVIGSASLCDEAFAERYRIDVNPRAQVSEVEALAQKPWLAVEQFAEQMMENGIYSGTIDLMQFVVESTKDGEAEEGRDFPKYNRKEHFGGWVQRDPDKSCANVRAEVLVRDSQVEVKWRKSGCSVESGLWNDPYSGNELRSAEDIQIDHVVPLHNAYQMGGWKWPAPFKCHYSNYLGNQFHLMAVYGAENSRKSDKTPAGYMPANREYACNYISNWLRIKAIWNLMLEDDEVDAIRRLVTTHRCQVELKTMPFQDLRQQRQLVNRPIEACADREITELPENDLL